MVLFIPEAESPLFLFRYCPGKPGRKETNQGQLGFQKKVLGRPSLCTGDSLIAMRWATDIHKLVLIWIFFESGCPSQIFFVFHRGFLFASEPFAYEFFLASPLYLSDGIRPELVLAVTQFDHASSASSTLFVFILLEQTWFYYLAAYSVMLGWLLSSMASQHYKDLIKSGWTAICFDSTLIMASAQVCRLLARWCCTIICDSVDVVAVFCLCGRLNDIIAFQISSS